MCSLSLQVNGEAAKTLDHPTVVHLIKGKLIDFTKNVSILNQLYAANKEQIFVIDKLSIVQV